MDEKWSQSHGIPSKLAYILLLLNLPHGHRGSGKRSETVDLEASINYKVHFRVREREKREKSAWRASIHLKISTFNIGINQTVL